MGGIYRDNSFDATAIALFVRSDGSAGVVKTGLIEGGFDRSAGTWEFNGTLKAIELGFTSVLLSPLHEPPSAEKRLFQGDVWGDLGGQVEIETFHLMDANEWGVWWGMSGGGFSANPPTDWHSWTVNDALDDVVLLNTEINGTILPDNSLGAKVLGHYAEFEDPCTGILAGELVGTFDPGMLTWQAIQTGVFLDTQRFLAMADTQTGRDKLNELDIPHIQVGQANLTGFNGNMTVNMDDVRYFAYSTGGPPKVWATENIYGGFNNIPSSGELVALSGNGLSAKFYVKKWNTGRWLAEIRNGFGTYTGSGSMKGKSVEFYGGAAGRYSGNTFSGTGSGVAKKVP